MHPKPAARHLRDQLSAAGLNPLGQQRALNVIAALHGTDWNTLSARPDLPLLPPGAAGSALRTALAHYGVHVTLAWADVAAAALTGDPSTTSRDALYAPCGALRSTDPGALFRLKTVPATLPWPLLPLPSAVPSALHDRLRHGARLDWTPAAGLSVDGHAIPLTVNGAAWLSGLRRSAPTGVEVTYDAELSGVTRVTYTRPTTPSPAFSYRPGGAYARQFLRRARALTDLHYHEALHLARQARAYDAFITDLGLDPRGPHALTRVQDHALSTLEREVLRALPQGPCAIRDHVTQWRRDDRTLLTYEPYLHPEVAERHPATQAFRARGWTVTVRESAYNPPSAVMLILEPPAPPAVPPPASAT